MIKVETVVNADMAKVWDAWNNPQHIINWCFASDDWHAPKAENDLRVGGKFKTHMAAKDGSFGFEFGGDYTVVDLNNHIAYVLADGRKVDIRFSTLANGIQVTEMFDPEKENSEDMQQAGWQAILNNFKKYTESL